jgi:hypothetical protein
VGKALQEQVIGKFRDLNLHDRVAILVPDDNFKQQLKARLARFLEGYKTRNFRLVSADEASEAIADEANKEEWLVLETMERFDGLERLIVIAVGMDQPGAAIKGRGDDTLLRTRSLLYRALTRAHMLVCVVNVLHKEGLLSFLMHLKLKADGESSSSEQVHKVVPLTAQVLVNSQEKHAAAAAASERIHNSTTKADRQPDIDAYIREKKHKSKKDKTGQKKNKVIANNLWDTSANDHAQKPKVMPDFMPFDLEAEGVKDEPEVRAISTLF